MDNARRQERLQGNGTKWQSYLSSCCGLSRRVLAQLCRLLRLLLEFYAVRRIPRLRRVQPLLLRWLRERVLVRQSLLWLACTPHHRIKACRDVACRVHIKSSRVPTYFRTWQFFYNGRGKPRPYGISSRKKIFRH